jgi:hypothetical protein
MLFNAKWTIDYSDCHCVYALKRKRKFKCQFCTITCKRTKNKRPLLNGMWKPKKFKFVHGIYNNMTKRTIRQEDITFWYIQINMVTKLRLSVSLSMICKSSLWPFHMKFLSSRDKRDMKNYRWFLCVTRGRSPFTLTYIRQLALLKMDFSLHLASKINFLQEIYYHETKQWKYKYFP